MTQSDLKKVEVTQSSPPSAKNINIKEQMEKIEQEEILREDIGEESLSDKSSASHSVSDSTFSHHLNESPIIPDLTPQAQAKEKLMSKKSLKLNKN